MNGVHDLGGMHGFGPIPIEADEPLFHAPWEARVLALTLAMGAWGRWTIDASRFARESIPGPAYLAMTYYERLLAGLSALIGQAGLATPQEIVSGKPLPGVGAAEPPLRAARVPEVLARGGPTLRATDRDARFVPGARVRARNLNPPGHIRLPRYARGKVGVIVRDHGAHVLPDTNAHGLGENPEHLYGVRFEGRELWGEAGRDPVYLDLWERYLERA
jgi:nitrile hydratase